MEDLYIKFLTLKIGIYFEMSKYMPTNYEEIKGEGITLSSLLYILFSSLKIVQITNTKIKY